MMVFNDLKTRGVNDILIAVTDGLKGMPEALGAAYPATTPQTCIVHLIRNSLDYASWKDRKPPPLAAAIKPIYTATSAEAARAELEPSFAGKISDLYSAPCLKDRIAHQKRHCIFETFSLHCDISADLHGDLARQSILPHANTVTD